MVHNNCSVIIELVGGETIQGVIITSVEETEQKLENEFLHEHFKNYVMLEVNTSLVEFINPQNITAIWAQ